jgi:hypothetical protein
VRATAFGGWALAEERKMAKALIILIRVCFAVLLGLDGIYMLLQAGAAPAFVGFSLFGFPGAMMVLGLVAGAAILYCSARLFKTTLTLAPIPVTA